MTDQGQSLAAGLYFVATPIGTARDITLRALDILKDADVLAAEDTRNTRRLMDIHGISLNGRSLVAYHDHSSPAQRQRLVGQIESGKSVAYVSDAGTPLIADPGYALARDVIAAGLGVHAAPGPSAVLTALTLAGLPTDKFYFAGFLPVKSAARRKVLAKMANIPGSLVIFESPKRVHKTFIDLVHELGGDRQMALCRELTKKFEEVRRGTVADLADDLGDGTLKGEIVLVIGPAPDRDVDPAVLDDRLLAMLGDGMSLRDVVDKVTHDTEMPRKTVYRRALELEKKT